MNIKERMVQSIKNLKHRTSNKGTRFKIETNYSYGAVSEFEVTIESGNKIIAVGESLPGEYEELDEELSLDEQWMYLLSLAIDRALDKLKG